MPAVVARFAGFLFILLLLASSTGGADGPEDEAEFHYLHGFEASGEFEGECTLAGYRFDTGSPGELEFEAENVSLIVYRTWANSTVVGADGLPPGETPTEREQTATKIAVPNGTLTFSWRDDAHLFLTRNHIDETLHMTTALEGTMWLSGPVKNRLPAGPGFYHWPQNPYFPIPSSIEGTPRWVATDQDEYRITGDSFFKFDHVELNGDDFHIELPPYREFRRTMETPVLHTSSILHTYGLLRVEGLDLRVAEDEGDLGCGSLEWSGLGAATFRAATGEAFHGDDPQDFEFAEYTIHGKFDVSEDPGRVSTPWGDQLSVETLARGEFSSGKDFQVLGITQGTGPSLPTQLTLLGLLIGAILAAWKLGPLFFSFFTRIERNSALEHPVRDRIYQTAQSRPGSTLVDLVGESGNSYSTIQHHARLLVKLEMVSLMRFGREVHVFPSGTPRTKARKIVCIRKEPVRHLLNLIDGKHRRLREVRSMMQAEFQRGPSWATRVVGQAERAGLVVREKTENGVMLCIEES